jgi:hypothetical protein
MKVTLHKEQSPINVQPSKNLVQVNQKTKTPKTMNTTTKTKLIPKTPESRLTAFKSKVRSLFGEEKKEVPKKMINLQEKEGLISKLMNLKKIIEENEISSENSQVVNKHMDLIKKELLG